MHSTLSDLLQEAVQQRLFPGASIAYRLSWLHDLEFLNVGNIFFPGEMTENPAITSETLFDLASLTKSVVTGTLALWLHLDGKLDFSEPVRRWIPELNTSYAQDVQVFHLLTHTLDYRIPMSSLKHLPAEEIAQALLQAHFDQKPGSSFNYGNPPSILLGLLLERLTGDSLENLAQKRIFGPLQMQRTTFRPLRHFSVEEIVPTEYCSWRRRMIRGEVHDESAYALQSLWGDVGSAGLFGTASDLIKLLQTLLSDGIAPQGHRVFPPGILNLVSTNALSFLEGQGTALGWELANPRFMGEQVGPRVFGKTGFTGTSLYADPQKGQMMVLLSHFTWPQREASVERIYAFRRQVHQWLQSSDPPGSNPARIAQ